jgi:hypothetical protein
MANEQRAVVGDSPAVSPVPLVLFWTRLTTRNEKIPTSSRTSTDQAGYGKRTACRFWRQRHRGTSSTRSQLATLTTEKRKSLLRLVHPETKLAMANEQRAIVGDSATVRPVPLIPCSQRSRQKRENPYFVSYIHRPSWLWQTNSVPLLETAPPWDQFRLSCSGPVSQQEKRKSLLRLVHP